MRKTLLTLLAVMFSLHSAYADIEEDWTTKSWGPASQAITVLDFASPTNPDCHYWFKYTSAKGGLLSMKASTGYVEFTLPINCSQIKLLTNAGNGATVQIKFAANDNAIGAAMVASKGGQIYTIDIPAEYRAAGTKYKISSAKGAPKFDKFTYVEAVDGPTMSVSATDLAFATPLNGTQSKTVKGNAEGLTEDITVTVDNEAFSAPATLTAEALAAGFDVTFTGSAAQNYTGTLTLKSGDLTATVALTGYAVAHQGTEADPLTPADVIAMNNLNFGPFYIQGTISDKCADRGTDGIAETTVLTENNIILVGDDGKKIGVNLQLQDVIDVLSIVSNPDNAGNTVIIKGNLVDYLGTPGVTNTEYVSGLTKALTVPYSLAFDEPETLADWTMLCPQIGDATPRQIFQYFTAGAAPFYSCPNAGVGSRYITSASAYEYKNSWLISPAIKLEAGKKYYVKYNVAATNGQNTNLGIYYGTEPTAEALTNQALEQRGYFGKGFFPESNFFSIEGTMTPSANGVYYVGLYNNDDKYNSANLIVFDISIIEAASGDMPGAPTDFTATAAADGDLYVVLSAKAPTTDAAGNDLAELTALEFLRGDKVINTVNNPEKGKVYTYTDKEAVNGLNKYAVRAVNSKGNSDLVETSAKAGLQIPKELESITAEQTSTGMVKFTWKKPLYDFYGTMFVNPDLVTVKIEAYDGATLIKTFELKGDDATVELLPETTVDQKFFNFKAYAMTNGGPSLNGIDLNGIAVGKPSELPYSENFAGNEAHNPMYNSTNEGQYGYRASWDFVNSIEDVPVACLNGQAYGSQASLISGLIEIPAGSENQMTFKYSNNGSMSAANILTVKINGEEVWSKTVSNSEFDTAEIDLTPYAGKTIQFSLTGKQTNALHYRNIIVTDILIDKKSGIADIEADENAPVEYFNLQGIRVENPAAGIYIRRQGSKVTKVLVK